MTAGLGRLIVGRRRELGMTQQELARRLGVPTANLSQIEHSPSRWQSRLLWALAAELQLPQLELALAAGVITDLPPLDSSTDDLTLDFNELVRTYLNGDSGRGDTMRGRARLMRMIEKLEPEDAEFLAVVARQLIDRRRQPIGAASDGPFTDVTH